MRERNPRKILIKNIKRWIKDYDNKKEHDLDLTINLKDDARSLLEQSLILIEGDLDK